MKAFSLSSSRKPLTKLELEKQKKLEADAEAAKAYEEFVATFDQESPALVPKTFIKSGVIVPGSGGTDKQFFLSYLYPVSKCEGFPINFSESLEKASSNFRYFNNAI